MSSQEITQQQPRTPAQSLVAGIRSDTFKQQIAMALPPTVTPERFQRIAITAIQTNQDIAQCDPDSVIRSLLRAAADGLMPDGREAAIVKRKDQASYMPMVFGLRKIAAEYGWTLKARVVYSNDEFEYSEEPEVLRHIPVRPGGQRGERLAAYAIATHKDGRRAQRVMYADEIAKRRAKATADRVWAEWTDEMWAKTPVRDLFADLAMGDSDLERERIKRLLDETDLAPGDPARALYGPSRTETPALPAGTDTTNTDETTTSPPPPAEQSSAGADPQAASAAAASLSAADAAPGTQGDDEPDVGGSEGFNSADGPSDDDIRLAGQQAAIFSILNGKHRDVTIGELFERDPDGARGWLRNRLGVVSEPQPYVVALWNFARVFEPELYHEALAKKEAEAAA